MSSPSGSPDGAVTETIENEEGSEPRYTLATTNLISSSEEITLGAAEEESTEVGASLTLRNLT
jgi:hypothetical protein